MAQIKSYVGLYSLRISIPNANDSK